MYLGKLAQDFPGPFCMLKSLVLSNFWNAYSYYNKLHCCEPEIKKVSQKNICIFLKK